MISYCRLEDLRKEKGLSRNDLAKLSGISMYTIQKLEDGRLNLCECKLSTLTKLAKSLKTKVRTLIDDEEVRKRL